jgi:hypothetical protein
VTIAPENGILPTRDGSEALVRGAMAGFFRTREGSLQRRTDELIAGLERTNPGLAPLRGQRKGTRLNGREAESVLMEAPSIDNRRELIWLNSVASPRGLFYIVFVAPESDYPALRPHFQNILRSVSFN